MASTRSLTWVHRIGYVCTLVVAIAVSVILYGAGLEIFRGWQFRAYEIEGTRTHQSHLSSEGWVGGAAFKMLSKLPAGTARDSLRFVAMPSFGFRWFAISIDGSGQADARGTLVVLVRSQDKTTARSDTIPFRLAHDRYMRLMRNFDALTDNYAGDSEGCLDGTPVAFEKTRGAAVTSGVGNASCSDHYRAVSDAVLTELRRSTSISDLPKTSDWMSDPEKRP